MQQLVKFPNVLLLINIYIFVHTSHLPRVVDLLGNEAVDDEQVEEGEEAEEPVVQTSQRFDPARNFKCFFTNQPEI